MNSSGHQQNATQIISEIANVASDEDTTIDICLGIRRTGAKPPELRRLRVSVELAKDFKASAVALVTGIRSDIQQAKKSVHPYDAGSNMRSDEIEYFTPEEGSTPLLIAQTLSDIESLQYLKHGARGHSNYSFYAQVLRDREGNEHYLFRRFTRAKEITRKKTWIFATIKDEIFDSLHSDVFIFDEKIDAIYSNGIYLIMDQRGFHTIFEFFENAIEKSGLILNQIAKDIAMENINEFKSAVGRNAALLLRLKSASEKDELTARDMDALEAIAKDFNLEIEFTGEKGARKIVFKREYLRQIIDLLDDSLLRSDQTKLKYAVTGKRTT